MRRRILAACGGWSPLAWGDVEFSPLLRYALDVTGVSGRRIRIAFVNTAAGDQRADEGRELAAAAAAGVDATHVRLFARKPPELREALLGSDLIWVGGGSVVNLLAVWRAHDLDATLREALEAGTVLAGTSAGALCWHTGGPSTSFGDMSIVTDGLGFVPGSLGVHYDSQPDRRPALHAAVASGALADGYGLDEGAAVLYVDERATAFVSETPQGTVHRVERAGDRVIEHRLEARMLGG